jgi:hypothetical protein
MTPNVSKTGYHKFRVAIKAFALAAMLGAMSMPALAHGGGGGGGGHGGGRGGHGGGFGGFHGGFRGGFFGGYGFGGFGFYDPFWGYPFWGYPYAGYAYGYPAYAYPMPYGYPYGYPAAAPPPADPAQGAPAAPAPQSQSFWYYCPPSKAYYPYVSSCAKPWQQVPTTPPH